MARNYIDNIAVYIWDQVNGSDQTLSVSHLALYRIYAVLALTRGVYTSWKDVHDAWSAWMAGVRPDHHALVPFSDLSIDVQEKDAPYCEAIRSAAFAISQGRL